jgi:hypothetical protein
MNSQNTQGMSQGAKIGLVILLLLLAVGGYFYFFLMRPAQQVEEPIAIPTTPTNTSTASPSSRQVEVLPVPFLISEAPANLEAAAPAIIAAKPRTLVPPNPFVPLVSAAPSTAVATPTVFNPGGSTRIPTTTQRVQINQPQTRLQTTSLLNAPSGVGQSLPLASAGLSRGGNTRTNLGLGTLGSGPLPLRLSPLEKEFAVTSSGITSTSTPQAGENSVRRYVREQGLKLSAVVLGPTGVGIFQTKEGFVVLSVGRSLPGSEVLLKSLNASEVQLVQGNEALSLAVDETP